MTAAGIRCWWEEAPRNGDGWWVALGALAIRVVIVWWAADRIPPTADGEYYHIVATRIATGAGYTWLWPDGAVTYAAHYPVGYPAAVALLYAVFGSRPVWAMLLNALLGAASVVAAHRLAGTVASRAGALCAALLVAVHPTLVAYTPALMTEGVVGALLALAGWLAVSVRIVPGWRYWLGLVALGLLLGASTLTRPQVVLLAPAFGWLAVRRVLVEPSQARRHPVLPALWPSVLVGVLAVGTCLPWTLRNCFRMNSDEPSRFASRACLFVSANAGWNLLVGAGPGANGTWMPLEQVGFPEECREVFGEADKDRCFGRAARGHILHEPWRFVGLMPRKLAATFNGCRVASWYLRTANPDSVGHRAEQRLGAAETLFQRLLLVLCLVAAALAVEARQTLPARRWGVACLLVAMICLALSPLQWVAYLGLPLLALMGIPGLSRQHPPLFLCSTVVLVTSLAHAVFFGAERYSLVCFTLMAALAGTVFPLRTARELTSASRAADTEEREETPGCR